jgi:segregation and condensation protein A
MLEVTTEKFQGPLGVMLRLIEQEELDITEIALAKIADSYLAYIQESDTISPEEMADFLVMAARLLYIKSKALLPYLVSEEEDEEVVELQNQLRMYQEFVAASQKVAALAGAKRFLFSPPLAAKNFRRLKREKPKFFPPKGVTAALLHDRCAELVARLQKQAARLEERRLIPKISIDEQIVYIRQILTEKVRFSFSKFLKAAKNKTEVIVNFLAVLELAKQKELIFEQDSLFSEINVVRRDDNLTA